MQVQDERKVAGDALTNNKLKIQHLVESTLGESNDAREPPSGMTQAAPQFKANLKALLFLTQSEKPILQRVRSAKYVHQAYYGFGDASSGGFGSSVESPDGLFVHQGLWPSNQDESSNYLELKNLVDATYKEVGAGYLKGAEFWLFTDNSTAERCFHKGSSSSELLHELVLKLRKLEFDFDFSLFAVHVLGTRMIAQGTDGLSCGLLLKGVLGRHGMLSFVNLARTAIERQPFLGLYMQEWVSQALNWRAIHLSPGKWFNKGHGIVGGTKDHHGIWIPDDAKNRRVYLWTPPPRDC